MSSTTQIDTKNQAVVKADLAKTISLGQVTGNGIVVTPLPYYEEFSISLTYNSGASFGPFTLVGVRTGNLVTLRFPAVQANFSNYGSVTNWIDSRFRPPTTTYKEVPGMNVGNPTTIILYVGTNGFGMVGLNNMPFGGTGTSGCKACCVTYLLR